MQQTRLPMYDPSIDQWNRIWHVRGQANTTIMHDLQDVAGREIYEQRRPSNREDRDQDGRLAISMDRIRQEFGWLAPDGECAEAGGGFMEGDAEHPRAAARLHEELEDDAGEGGDESRSVSEREDQAVGQGSVQWPQVSAAIALHGGFGLVDISKFGDGLL